MKRPVKNWPFSFPALVHVITRGGREARAHVMELVKHRPHVALPHLSELAILLDSTQTPVRNAAIEILATLSRAAPGAMAFLLPRLHALLANEPHNALASHAIEILSNYGKTSAEAAKKVIPILRNAGGNHVEHASKAISELTSGPV